MRYHFTLAAIVSVLMAVAATVQGAPGKWLYLGVAVVTVALEILTRRRTTISSSPGEVYDEAQPTPPRVSPRRHVTSGELLVRVLLRGLTSRTKPGHR
jgi:hypothetical protein